MPDILQLSNKDIINIHRIRDTPSYRGLRPFELTTQRGWAIGLNAKNVAEYMNQADIAAILNAAPTLNIATATDYVSGNGQDNRLYRSKIDQKIVEIYADARFDSRPLSAPSDVRQKFNIISGDQGNSFDPIGNRHRVEFASGTTTFAGGTDIWLSYGLKINSMGILEIPGAYAICGQWHGNDSKTPPFSFNFKDGKPGLWTTSSGDLDTNGTDGKLIERWRSSTAWIPGVQHYAVVHAKTGAAASAVLQFWLDGAIVKDFGPAGVDGLLSNGLGYYAIGGNSTYLNYGIYCADYNHPDVVAAGPVAVAAARAAVSEVEYANMEWGTTNLFARVATPLMIT